MALDFYATPHWAIVPILEHLPRGGTVLDTGCGEGNILRALLEAGWASESLFGIELDEARARLCGDDTGAEVEHGDFLTGSPRLSFDLVIGNPPFTHSEAFARRALDVVSTRRGSAALLLRLEFLETAERLSFHRQFPSDVFVFPLRPSFTGDGKCDSAAYAWFVWGPGRGGRWSILDVAKPTATRRAKEVAA